MSRSILSLVEQRYREKITRTLTIIKNELNRETKGVPVRFKWRSPWTDKSYLVEGTVTDASLQTDNTINFVVQFDNPESEDGSKLTATRKVLEFYE